ncbi:hypothetical protein [Acidovorax sp.]|uniref:hypothetical protein n=1 Tax=Acidovorax sp. TaxID=1872122 RepID=UPI0031D074CF
MTTSSEPRDHIKQAWLHVFRLEKAKKAANSSNEQFTEAVRRDLFRSLCPMMILALLASLVLCFTGRIGADFDLHIGRLSSSVGAFLAGWATWFALADRYESYSGDRPDERARNGIFKVLMWPGVFLSVVGAAWWP